MPDDVLVRLAHAFTDYEATLRIVLRKRSAPNDTEAMLHVIIEATRTTFHERIEQDSRTRKRWEKKLLQPERQGERELLFLAEARRQQVQAWFDAEIGAGCEDLVTELGKRYPAIFRAGLRAALLNVTETFPDTASGASCRRDDEHSSGSRHPYALQNFFPTRTNPTRAHIRERLLAMAADRLDRSAWRSRMEELTSAAINALGNKFEVGSDTAGLKGFVDDVRKAHKDFPHYLTDRYPTGEALADAIWRREKARASGKRKETSFNDDWIQRRTSRRNNSEVQEPEGNRPPLTMILSRWRAGGYPAAPLAWSALHHHLDALHRVVDVWTTVPPDQLTPSRCWEIWQLLETYPRIREYPPPEYLSVLCEQAAAVAENRVSRRADGGRFRRLLEIRLKIQWGLIQPTDYTAHWPSVLQSDPGSATSDERGRGRSHPDLVQASEEVHARAAGVSVRGRACPPSTAIPHGRAHRRNSGRSHPRRARGHPERRDPESTADAVDRTIGSHTRLRGGRRG